MNTIDIERQGVTEMHRSSTLAIALAAILTLSLGPAAFADNCASSKKARSASNDIVDTALAAGSFTTLAKALAAADLVDTLKKPGPFTVLAPTDEAFAKLPAGTVESLLQPENKHQLVDVLTYHVVPGNVSAADAVAVQRAHTAEGSAVEFSIVDGQLTVNEASVIASDIATSNGTIHVIDNVLLPN